MKRITLLLTLVVLCISFANAGTVVFDFTDKNETFGLDNTSYSTNIPSGTPINSGAVSLLFTGTSNSASTNTAWGIVWGDGLNIMPSLNPKFTLSIDEGLITEVEFETSEWISLTVDGKDENISLWDGSEQSITFNAGKSKDNSKIYKITVTYSENSGYNLTFPPVFQTIKPGETFDASAILTVTPASMKGNVKYSIADGAAQYLSIDEKTGLITANSIGNTSNIPYLFEVFATLYDNDKKPVAQSSFNLHIGDNTLKLEFTINSSSIYGSSITTSTKLTTIISQGGDFIESLSADNVYCASQNGLRFPEANSCFEFKLKKELIKPVESLMMECEALDEGCIISVNEVKAELPKGSVQTIEFKNPDIKDPGTFKIASANQPKKVFFVLSITINFAPDELPGGDPFEGKEIEVSNVDGITDIIFDKENKIIKISTLNSDKVALNITAPKGVTNVYYRYTQEKLSNEIDDAYGLLPKYQATEGYDEGTYLGNNTYQIQLPVGYKGELSLLHVNEDTNASREDTYSYEVQYNELLMVTEIISEESDARYFSLQGLPVYNPEKGKLYIRVSKGSAQKVIF